MEIIAASEARANLASLVRRAAQDNQRTIIKHRGRPQAALVSIEDLEYLETREQTRLQENLHAAIESLSETFALWDFEDRLVLCNAKLRDLNREIEEYLLPGTKFEDHIRAIVDKNLVADANGREEEWITERLASHSNPGKPFEIKRQDDTWILVQEERLPDGSTVTISTDITKHKHSEEQAIQAHDQLNSAIEALPDGLVIFDNDSRLLMSSTKYRELHPIVSDLMTPGTSFESIIRAGAEKGQHVDAVGREKEWIEEQLLAFHDPAEPIEQQFNDGRWRRVYERKMAGGGTVGVRTDITELKQREQQLRDSEQRLSDYLDASSDWFWEMDENLRFTKFSNFFDNSTGVAAEEMLGKTREETVIPDVDPVAWQGLLDDLAAHRSFRDFRNPRTLPDGQVVTLSISGKAIFDDDGNFLGYRGTGRDITSQVAAEQQADRAEILLANAIENISDGFVLFDADLKIVKSNSKFTELLEYPEELGRPGTCMADGLRFDAERGVYGPGDPGDIVSEMLSRPRTTEPYTFERTLNSGRCLEVFRNPTPDGGVVALHRDITELKQSERQLQDSEQRLTDYLEASSDWFWEMDENCRFSNFSNMLEKVTGVAATDLLGKTREETGIPGIDALAWQEHLDNLAARRSFRDFRHPRTLTDGKVITLSINGKAIFDQDGAFQGYRGTGRDITDFAAAETQARQAELYLAGAVDGLSEMFVLWDKDDRLVLCNEKFREVNRPATGASDPGVSFFDHFRLGLKANLFPDAEGKAEDWYAERLALHRNPMGPFEVARQDGTWLLVNEQKMPDGGIVTISADITERKKAEEALRQARVKLEERVQLRTEELQAANDELRASEQRFQDYAEASADWFWEMDADLRFTYMSPNVERVVGVEPEWHYGKTREELLGDDYDPEIWDAHLETLQRHEPFKDFAYYRVGGDIEARWLCTSGVPIFDEDGDFQGYRGSGSDITALKATEDALREREIMLNAVVENVPMSLSLKDREGRFTLVNPGFERLHKITAEKALGKTFFDILPEEIAADAAAEDRQVLETGEQLRTEYSWPSHLGLQHELIFKFPLHVQNENQLSGVGVIALDVTEHREAERALRESEKNLRGILENSPIGVSVSDYTEIDGVLKAHRLFANNALVSLLGGRSAEKLVASDISDTWVDLDQLDALNQKMKNGENLVDFEVRRRRIDGVELWISLNSRPIRFDNKDCTMIWHFDITERKRAEKEIEDSRDQLRLMTDKLPVTIVYLNKKLRVDFANSTAEQRYGRPASDIIGRHIKDIAVGDSWDKVKHYVERSMQGEILTFEEDFVYPDGTNWDAHMTYVPHFNDEGEVLGICVTMADITEQKRTDERLRQAQKMEAVGQLTGGVAHDFNNLLAVIMGNSELLEDKLGQQDAALEAILRASTRGAELTQRLLAFSRRQPLQPQAIDLGVLVSSMSELLSRTLGETIEIKISAAADLWTAEADPGQVENALLNLALNARDAMSAGGKLVVECINTRLGQEYVADNPEAKIGNYVVLSVSDQGTGMTEDVKSHAFEPFFTTKEVGEGSGLGLSMIYGFAKQSDGHVAIESEEGQGTTVKLYLPRAAAGLVTQTGQSAKKIPQGKAERVLVIEDAADVRELAVQMLRSLNYQVFEAEDVAAARSVLSECPQIDLILSDVVLPGGTNGPKFAQEVWAKDPDAKIIFMSGYASDAVAGDKLLRSGAVLLNKPFERGLLAKTVREVLDD